MLIVSGTKNENIPIAQAFFPDLVTRLRSIFTPIKNKNIMIPKYEIVWLMYNVLGGNTHFCMSSLCPKTDGPSTKPA